MLSQPKQKWEGRTGTSYHQTRKEITVKRRTRENEKVMEELKEKGTAATKQQTGKQMTEIEGACQMSYKQQFTVQHAHSENRTLCTDSAGKSQGCVAAEHHEADGEIAQ